MTDDVRAEIAKRIVGQRTVVDQLLKPVSPSLGLQLVPGRGDPIYLQNRGTERYLFRDDHERWFILQPSAKKSVDDFVRWVYLPEGKPAEIAEKCDDLGLDTYTLEGTLSGPLFTDKLRFFVSGRRNVDDGHIYGRREHLPSDQAVFNVTGEGREALIAEIQRYLPDFDPESDPVSYYEMHGVPWYQIEADPALADSIAGVSELVSLNPSSSYNLLSKLTVRPFPQAKLQYSFLIDGSERQDFDFDYRFNPDGQATIRENSFNHSLHWTHTLDDRSFYTVKLSYAQNEYRYGTYENPFDLRYVPDLSGSGQGPVRGLPANNFYFAGNEKTHIYEDASSWRGKLDFTRQFGVRHEAKAGIDVQFHELERENFEVLYDLDRYREPSVENVNTAARDKYGCTEFFDVPEGVDYLYPQGKPDGVTVGDCAPQRVLEVAAYAQDKIEFDNFIINAGVRYERFDPNGTYIPSLLDLDEYVLVREGDTPEDLKPLPEADIKHMVLPRLGVSFPITERGIIHFSYGHFAQMPALRNMYRNPELEFPANSVPTFGNPNMRPERTVQYEIGLQQQLGDQLAFNVTGYFKDIRDYLTLQRIRYSTIAGEDSYRIYQNKDYANVKGVTFSLTKRRSRDGLLSATIDYTYQVAEGNNDDTDAFFFSFLSGREREFEIVPLDFDQRNVLSGTVSIARPGNWGLSLIGQYATGYPYSPVLYDQNLDLLPNSDRKPSQVQLDARLFKEFDLDVLQVRAFAQVYNVLDYMNERYVFDDTGRATYSLNVDNPHQAWQAYYGLPGVHTLDEWNTRPHWFSAPRSARLGLTLVF